MMAKFSFELLKLKIPKLLHPKGKRGKDFLKTTSKMRKIKDKISKTENSKTKKTVEDENEMYE